MSEREALEAAMAALQAQRGVLGDAVVESALGPMRERLRQLTAPVPGASPEQARRQVSVLFLDVVGSTALSQHLDPEDVHAVMDGALERCTVVVRAHDGRVLQYAGDNLLAAFGADQAREDDAERAVRCGLALLQEGAALRERVLREHGHGGCDVRVGIHTGPVLLGGGVDDEGTIRGLAVNVAARMEQTAPAGALRISHDTWALVRGVFEVQPQPPLLVKGRDEPITTYLVQRELPRGDRAPARGVEGLLPPMVGRDAELRQLLSLLGEVAALRALRAATLVGEPGLGKTRLLHELQAALRAQPQPTWLLLGRAHPSSRLQPYGVLRDLLAWRLQIADSDGLEQAKSKLVAGLVPWLGGERVDARAQLIGQLIGLDFSQSAHVRGLEPRLLRDLAFAALHDYLRGLGAQGAVPLLVLEDLHWADDGSLDFVAGLLEAGTAPALLLLCTARPELLERRPAWGQGNAAHQLMPLAALSAADGEHLARALLQRASGGADALRALLIEQADGNPFYMEELVRMFIDDGVIAVDGERWRVLPERLRQAHVPTTLVGVLQARLDALPVADRLALQQASIVGHVFWDQALAAIDPHAPSAVPALRARSLVHQRGSSAFEGTAEEAFHHHLLQQVTYDTVLKPARRAGHAAAAQWLAERVGDRPAEYLAITAQHYERAGDDAQALDYFHRAADDATARFANQAALEYAERALNNPAATDLRRRERLMMIEQAVADLTGDRARQEAVLERRALSAEALDDDMLRADVLMSRALLASRRGDEKRAFDLAVRAAELAERCGNTDAAALALGQMAWALWTQGEVAAALDHVRRALDRIREALRGGSTSKRHLTEVQLLTLCAIVEKTVGDLRQARNTCAEALDLAQRHGMRRPQVSTLEALGMLELSAGRAAEALRCFGENVTRAEEIGWVVYSATGHCNMARCELELGRADVALQRLAMAEDRARRCQSSEVQARCLHLRGRVHAQAAGQAASAHDAFDRAVALLLSINAAPLAWYARADQALLHLRQGDLAQAQRLVEQIAVEQAAGLSFASIDEPLFPLLACHRVWAACGDGRAMQAIDTAYAELHATAARSGDEATREGILNGITLSREIVAAWQAAHE